MDAITPKKYSALDTHEYDPRFLIPVAYYLWPYRLHYLVIIKQRESHANVQATEPCGTLIGAFSLAIVSQILLVV